LPEIPEKTNFVYEGQGQHRGHKRLREVDICCDDNECIGSSGYISVAVMCSEPANVLQLQQEQQQRSYSFTRKFLGESSS